MVWLACAAVVGVILLVSFGAEIAHLELKERSDCGHTRAIPIFLKVGLFDLIILDGAQIFKREY